MMRRLSLSSVSWSFAAGAALALAACGDDSSDDPATSSTTSSGSGSTTSTGSTSATTSSAGQGGEASTGTGSGGDAGPGGAGTGSGGGDPCDVVEDCPDHGVCVTTECVDGFCADTPLPDGTAVDPDGNPCTDDACLGGEATHAPLPAGAAGSDEGGGCDGVCQAAPFDGECGLSAYRKVYPGGDDTWTREALSSVWTGEGAPPPRDLLEAEQTFAQGRLMVWASDGTYYERRGGVWDAPVAATERFEGLPTGEVVALTVAHAPTFGVADETLSITTNEAVPRALSYALLADGAVALSSGPDPIGNAQTGDPEAPPQHTTPYDWGFAAQAAEAFQADGWLHFWEALGGRIYDLDGSSGGFDFLGSEAEADSDLFAGSGGPAPGSVVAAYYDAATDQVFLIAP